MRDMFGYTNFNQDLSNWCVTNITSEPSGFATSSPLTTENKPVWGTCPSATSTSTTSSDTTNNNCTISSSLTSGSDNQTVVQGNQIQTITYSISSDCNPSPPSALGLPPKRNSPAHECIGVCCPGPTRHCQVQNLMLAPTMHIKSPPRLSTQVTPMILRTSDFMPPIRVGREGGG